MTCKRISVILVYIYDSYDILLVCLESHKVESIGCMTHVIHKVASKVDVVQVVCGG